MHAKEEGLYLGWRWSQASGAVARRCGAGRPAAPMKTIGVAESLPRVLLLHKKAIC